MDTLIRMGVTGDFSIPGVANTDRAFKPGLGFFEGNFTSSQLKKWLLSLEFLDMFQLKLMIKDPMKATNYHNYFIDYDNLELDPKSSMALRINCRELSRAIKDSLKEDTITDNSAVQDNSEFLKDFIDKGIQEANNTKG